MLMGEDRVMGDGYPGPNDRPRSAAAGAPAIAIRRRFWCVRLSKAAQIFGGQLAASPEARVVEALVAIVVGVTLRHGAGRR